MTPMPAISFLLFSVVCFTDAVCPVGWVLYRGGCYYFSPDAQTWSDGKVTCEETMHGKLVEIDTSYENDFLAKEAKKRDNPHWIALSYVAEENTWIWKNRLTYATYTHWSDGEPNNDGGESCGLLLGNGYWKDEQCNNTFHFICEKSNRYRLIIIGKR